MIVNIIDDRERRFRWKSIHAIVEAVQQDNGNDDADQAPLHDSDDLNLYEERFGISVNEALHWANSLDQSVTLYLRDMMQ